MTIIEGDTTMELPVVVEEVRKWRITVLISGSGSNLGALISNLPNKLKNCSIISVISSKSNVFGLKRAESSLIPTEVFNLTKFKKLNPSKNRLNFDLELSKKIKLTKPDLVILAGWMLILSKEFLFELKRDWDEETVGNINNDTTTLDTTTTTDTTTPPITKKNWLDTPGISPYPIKVQSNLFGKSIPIINLHPALPGTFPGAHAILDAYNNFNAPESISISTSTSTSTSTLEDSIPISLDSLSLDTPSSSTTSTSPSTSLSPSSSSPTPIERITKTGIMIHKVIPLLDAGEPIIIKEIDMKKGESLEGLETRIHEIEHIAIVEAVEKIVDLLGKGEWWSDEEGEE